MPETKNGLRTWHTDAKFLDHFLFLAFAISIPYFIIQLLPNNLYMCIEGTVLIVTNCYGENHDFWSPESHD